MSVRKSRAQIIAQLKKEKFIFNEFTLSHEGDYAVDDADWNYKDIPHLHYVHQLAEAVPTYVDDKHIASIVVQKIPGFRIPLAVFIYENTPSSQLYYTASFFFILIIESTYNYISPNRTKVETTYSIGTSRLLTWTFPMLRWLIKRNYKDLMSTDIPMRERRGQLRKWGYKFYKALSTYSYYKSIDIKPTNVIVPHDLETNAPIDLNINKILPQNGEYLWGRDDAWGLRIIRKDDVISIFARMCHHEGASLDESPCKNGKIQCPWHGKVFHPLTHFNINNAVENPVITRFHEFWYDGGILKVKNIIYEEILA